MTKSTISLLIAAAFVIAIGVGACKGSDSKSKPKPKPKKSAVVLKFEALEKKACACKDAACVKKVQKELSALAGDTTLRPSEEEQNKLEGVVRRTSKCIVKALMKKAK